MKNLLILATIFAISASPLRAQSTASEKQSKSINILIDKYSEAREKKDTMLLKTILTNDIDQLVSTGEWRNGLQSSVKGMLKSSAATPGTRSLTIDRIRMIGASSAIVDCKYEIANGDGTRRKMWSTFIVVEEKANWKISAIRNMLPSEQK